MVVMNVENGFIALMCSALTDELMKVVAKYGDANIKYAHKMQSGPLFCQEEASLQHK